MRITVLVEGKTEQVFKPILVDFLQSRLAGKMPRLIVRKYDGRIEKGDALYKRVEVELSEPNASDYVIALTDVYTGTKDFVDAQDARAKMTSWVRGEKRFFAHAAQHDFEAWLLPYWSDIQVLAGSNRGSPGPDPESVNHYKPPAYHLAEIYRLGKRRSYVKTVEAPRILQGKDLMVSINQCSELKAFINRILELCGGTVIL